VTAIGIILQVGACIIIKKVHMSFKKALEDYVDFLLMFEETPRSKFAKKYIPPMDVLAEETASQYVSTLRGSTNSQILQQSRMFGVMPEFGLSSREVSHRTQGYNQYEQEIQLDLP
jgi:hypothetical protein